MPFILAHAVYALKYRTVYGEYILMFFICTYIPVSEGAADCYAYNNGV